MTNNGKIIRPDYQHTELEQLALKTIEIYYEISNQIQNGLDPNLKVAQSTIFVLEECIEAMAKTETALVKTLLTRKMSPYNRERGNYLHRAFEPAFKFTSDEKEQKSIKIKDIVTIVRLFDFYVHKISPKYEDEASKITTEFIKDLSVWYRSASGEKASKSSIYEYKKEDTLSINLFLEKANEADFQEEILFRKDILINFFTNNDINKFPDKYRNLKKIVTDFYLYIQQVLVD